MVRGLFVVVIEFAVIIINVAGMITIIIVIITFKAYTEWVYLVCYNYLKLSRERQNPESYSIEHPVEYLKWGTPKNHLWSN